MQEHDLALKVRRVPLLVRRVILMLFKGYVVFISLIDVETVLVLWILENVKDEGSMLLFYRFFLVPFQESGRLLPLTRFRYDAEQRLAYRGFGVLRVPPNLSEL